MDTVLLITLLALGLGLHLAAARNSFPGRPRVGPEVDSGSSPESLRGRARRLRKRALSRVIDRYVAYLRGRERLLGVLPRGEPRRDRVERDIARARLGLGCYLSEFRRRGDVGA